MKYRQPSAFDGIAALRHLPEKSFVRSVGRAAAEWDFRDRADIPDTALEHAITTGSDVQIHVEPGTWGETPLSDLFALCCLVASSRPGTIFEFGTFTGLATVHLAMNAAPGALVHTLDLPPAKRESMDLDWEGAIDDEVIGKLWRGTPWETAIIQHLCDSRAFDTTELDGAVDFAFVDGAHSYEFVANDSAKAIDMVRSGGVIAWHDYSRTCPDVQRYLGSLPEAFGVRSIIGTNLAFATRP